MQSIGLKVCVYFFFVFSVLCGSTAGAEETLLENAEDMAQEAPSFQDLDQAFRSAFEEKDWHKAQNIGEEMLKLSPDNISVISALGIAYAQEPEHALKAEALFLKVHAVNKEDPTNLRHLAIIKSQLNRKDTLEFLYAAIDADEGARDLQNLTLRILEQEKRYDEMFKLYESMMAKYPEDLMILTGIGALYSRRGEYNRLADHYLSAVERGIKSNLVYTNLVGALLHAARYEEAKKWAMTAIEFSGDSTLSSFYMQACIKLGDLDDVLAAAERRTSLEQRLDERERYYVAHALSLQGCDDEAFKRCQSEGEKPRCCEKDAQALTAFRSLYEEFQENPKDYAHEKDLALRYGLALLVNGALEEAEAVLQNALDTAKEKRDGIGAHFAALATVMFSFDEARDIDLSFQYYTEAIENAPDFANPERVREVREWPPRAVDILTALNERFHHRQKKASSKCGCQVLGASEVSPYPLAWMLMLGLMGAFMFLRGKRRHVLLSKED